MNIIDDAHLNRSNLLLRLVLLSNKYAKNKPGIQRKPKNSSSLGRNSILCNRLKILKRVKHPALIKWTSRFSRIILKSQLKITKGM